MIKILGDFQMIGKKFNAAIIALILMMGTGALSAIEKGSPFGIVDFTKCIAESKYGKAEAENFEAIKNQLQKAVEDLEQQLTTTANQLQNPDVLDSLSPEAEKELKIKFQTLNEELNRYQGQYYQIMQQANMKLMQVLANEINQASEIIAKKDKIALVINKEAAFHYQEDLDITNLVMAEMDNKFDKEKNAAEVKLSKD